ncbi:MAG TPA: nickel pincer cofactor biosynthesis protein LarC [Candidatus Limnocylindrales bacterium]|nr:nickel pincer cofactor biosynthesis protein LarC [Candidatus Limnocylindrales bacterium]
MTPHCWIDASAGVAGDMLLGALVDAGAPLAAVQAAVDAVMPGTVRLAASEVRRAGLRATRVQVEVLVEDLPDRGWSDIRAMIEQAAIPACVRARSVGVFAALAEAEARVHGVAVEDVHFHEVGAWDSIADVVGVCAALHELDVAVVSAGPVALGSGQVQTAHGELPVPVPAVLELAIGWQVISGGTGELATPTGMALVRGLAEACQQLPDLTVAAHGVGAGTRDPAGRANVVRVVLGTLGAPRPAGAAGAPGAAVLIEANVDDLDPRVWPSVLADLLAAGASDAWLTPILMKKGRPAHTLGVLVEPHLVGGMRARVFALVPTLGVREQVVAKWALARTWRPVEVAEGAVRIKIGHSDGLITSATPEYADVAEIAERSGVPVRDVLAGAIAAAGSAGLVPGRTLPL